MSRKYQIDQTEGPHELGENEQDQKIYFSERFNYIPISPDLIDHVRRLDTLNFQELSKLKDLIVQIGQTIDSQFTLDDLDTELDSSSTQIQKFLIDTLKVHQILSLVDVDFAQLFKLKIEEQNLLPSSEHSKFSQNLVQKNIVKELLDSEVNIVLSAIKLYREISDQLNQHNGLNYVPREITSDGRMFEHASEASTLLNYLVTLKQRPSGSENLDLNQTINSGIHSQGHGSNSSGNLFNSSYYYQKEGIRSQMRQNKHTESKKVFRYVPDPATIKHDQTEIKEEEYFDSGLGNFYVRLIDENDKNQISEQLSQKLKIKNFNLQILIEISNECLALQSNAKGKADLYFHSYFWCEFLKKLEEIQDEIACKPRIKVVKDIQYDSGTDSNKTVPSNIFTQDQIIVNDPSSEDQSKTKTSLEAADTPTKLSKKQKGKKTPNQIQELQKISSEKEQDNQKLLENTKASTIRRNSQSPSRVKPIREIQQVLKTIETAPLLEISQKVSISQSGWISTMQGLAATMQKVIVNIKKFPFGIDHYNKYIQKFASEGMKYSNKKNKFMEEIQRALFVAQISNHKDSLYLLEKLLIQLMGFCDITIRDQAVVLLNMLYDELDWQLQEAFRPVIRTVGQHFIVQVNVQRTQDVREFPNLYIGLAAPSPLTGISENYITWHKIEQRNIIAYDKISLKITINFGKFWKSGFFDWRIVEINPQGRFIPCELIGKPQSVFPIVNKMNTAEVDDYYDQHYEDGNEEGQSSSTGLAQGRFIVHARGIREHTFHEVQIDFQNCQFDKTKKFFDKRGSFYEVEKALDDYAREGVTCLYLMGTLERDNYPILNKYSDRIEYRKDDCSPLAVISRDSANQMLGGDEGLRRVVQKAKQKGIKIIVDTLARISSSRHHRKYKQLLLHFLNEDGRREICYGTDGQAQKFEDTAMLNYRKVESWDLIIEEVITYAKKMKFDGIHLDNGQAWPQILEPDLEELKREDVDGIQAYSAEEFMAGEIVIRNENYGYWNTNNMETYANPFFIKLARRLWEFKPNFMILGECYGGFMFENRQIIMARSAVIPRLYRLPVALSQLFGKNLNKDGSINEQKKENIIVIKKWFNETKRFLPEGSILLQSSTSHSLPYPAYLYGKGTWATIDTLFFMPDIPITFMGEVNGEVYNPSQQTIFQAQQQELSSEPSENQGLKRVNSAIMQALTKRSDTENSTQPSEQKRLSQSPIGPIEEKRSLPKISSRANFTELDQSFPIAKKEQEFKQKLDPRLGYDLSKIKSHYLHRRRIRKEKMVLRYGELFFLTARNQELWIDEVLAYARYSLMETVIIATNFSDKNQTFQIDMEAIIPTFKQAYANNTVVMVRDCLDETVEPTYYFLRQFLEMRKTQELRPYHSLLISLQIVDDDQYIFKKCLSSSIDRLKKNLISGDAIEAEQISILFSDCIEFTYDDIDRFANVIGSIQTSFLDKINLSFDRMYKFNRKLVRSSELSSRLFAMSQFLLKNERGDNFCPAIRAVKSLNSCNNMGSIVFSTPELGRWSTVGGLGVMVDELSIGLVELGQDVTVISPYYDRNRKGQTGYLAQDPAGFKQVDNIHVTVNNQKVNLAVHEGIVRGVRLVFLHNGDCFPAPYVSNGAGHVVFQLAVFNKAVLEYCCRKSISPSIFVSNDWFTGLSAGYVKNGDFGTYFKDSKFIHICHNLQETYEGRIHTNQDQNFIHGLPRNWFSDNGHMVNPSKCALINCDQWATVSKSYRDELLQGSSLAYLLKQKNNPFAFPNGIPIKDRLKNLDAVAPDHLSAKRKLQMKYFNFGDLDDSVPVFSFVGRVTSQKGVHLICDVAENIIQKYNYKVQFLVGGPANMGEGYSAQCATKMWNLKNKYPNCFWAKPDDFFTDGSLVNRGSDFGLMPSAFEPGGIVQHEFFVGKTPVIAFKTGGLKDSVIEYRWDSEEGSGFIFEQYNHNDFIQAIERAINTYRNKEKYLKLRENAFRATMEGEVVCKAWLSEFCRLSEKNSVDQRAIMNTLSVFSNKTWSTQDFKPVSLIQEIFGNEQRQKLFCDIDQGANEKMRHNLDDEEDQQDQDINNQGNPNWKFGYNDLVDIGSMMSEFDKVSRHKKPKVFMLHNRGPRYQKVQLCGSMDEWKVRHDMQFDQITNQWFVNMHLNPGDTYLYKYIINNQHWVVNDEEPQKKDNSGNINNLCVVDDANLF